VIRKTAVAAALIVCTAGIGQTAERPRLRDLGVEIGILQPGPLNAITDVAGVQVGHSTIVEDFEDGRAVRTGVTAILPRGREAGDSAFAAWFSLNGNG